MFPHFVLGQGLLLRNTTTAVIETTVSGQVQDTDSVHTHAKLNYKNLISGSSCEVHSRLRLDFISCVQAVVVERTQPADPLVLNSFQFVTNITPTFSTTLVPSPSQLLLRGGDRVHQGFVVTCTVSVPYTYRERVPDI